MSEARLTAKRLRIMADALSQHLTGCCDEPDYWGNAYIVALQGAQAWVFAQLRRRGADALGDEAGK